MNRKSTHGAARKPVSELGTPAQRLRRFLTRAIIVLALTVLLLGALEGALALYGVAPMRFEEDPYVGFATQYPLFVEERDVDGILTPYRVTAPGKLPYFNYQRFLKEKPEDGFRIFCLGGSTTFGHPYEDIVSFPGWLRACLEDADPSRTWEVVNTGGISYASYRICLLMEELARYQPDLFIVYTGHNEFLERRSYPDFVTAPRVRLEAGAALRHLRSYAVMRRAARSLESEGKSRSVLPSEVTAILDHSNGPWAYERDDTLHDQVLEHFAFNLDRMARIAKAAGAEIIYVTPAGNLRDCSPFKATHREDLSDADRAAWDDAALHAGAAYDSGRYEEALPHLQAALELDDRHARIHFLHAQTFWQLGRYAEARIAFKRARDEDVCPLRALSVIPDQVRAAASANSATLVDFEAFTDAQAEHGIPGNDLFLDHVHPTIEMYRQLALLLLGRIEEMGVARIPPTWHSTRADALAEEVLARLGPADHCMAQMNIARVLRWGGKFEESDAMLFQAMATDPNDAEAAFLSGVASEDSGDLQGALALYRKAYALDPEFERAYINAGNVLSALDRHAEALAQFRKALELRPDYVLAYNNLANELAAVGQLEEAVVYYREALQLAPDYAEGHSNLGLALATLGRIKEAIAEYREALLLDPGLAPAHFNLASALIVEADWAGAEEHLEETCRLLPDFLPARERLAWVRVQRTLPSAE